MEVENRDRDIELEELLEKYGASARRTQGSSLLTPERNPTTRLRRFMSRDEDVKLSLQKATDLRPRSILCDNQSLRRPSPIRYDLDPDDSFRPRLAPSPISTHYPTPRSPITIKDKDIGESKAFSMAMKALQDRVKFLEGENGRLQEERGRALRMHTSADQFLSESEPSYRSRDQSDLVSSLSAELKDKSSALLKAEKEVKSLSEELRRMKETAMQSDHRRPDRVLETRCHSLEEQNIAQRTQIDQLRREVEDLRRGGRAQDQGRPGSLTPKERGKVMAGREESGERGGGRGKGGDDVGRYVATEGDYLESTRTAYFGEGTEEEKRGTDGFITCRLERELSDCNQHYKSLLQQSQDSHTDITTLRTELNSIATAMDAKSSQLSLHRQRSRDLSIKKNYGYV